MSTKKKCQDCPAVVDRREADALYRGQVMEKLNGYDKTLPRIEEAIITMSGTMQKNFNNIYFRIGVISGGSGMIGGLITGLIVKAFK